LETCKALTLGRVPLGSGGAGEGVAQRLARLRAEQARLSAELTALAEQSAGMDARERAELQAALQAASAAMERASQPLDQGVRAGLFPRARSPWSRAGNITPTHAPVLFNMEPPLTFCTPGVRGCHEVTTGRQPIYTTLKLRPPA